jgi:dTDP-4-dehydrorhamnose 3,5-epimerase
MEFEELPIPGCFLIKPKLFHDYRGTLVKPFAASEFAANGLRTDFVEQFFSTSAVNVLRGMHFQRPPHDHAKLAYCVAGRALDVLLDLRRSSSPYGQSCSLELSADAANSIYIGPGVGHGFLSTSEPALMVYSATSEYSPEHDEGVRWDNFGFNWGVTNPVLSARDAGFPALAEFSSPF